MADAVGGRWADQPVGKLVAEDYGRAMVFKRYGIDFCCGGGRSVASACREAGVLVEEVAGALEEAVARGTAAGGDEATAMELDALVEHIVARHHGYVRESIPTLLQFAEKVATVHGPKHPELLEVRDAFRDLSRKMERHMTEEEEVLFPRIVDLVARRKAGTGDGPGDESGVEGPIPALEDDHEHAGGLMARIRHLTSGFSPPPDACNTYRALFANLERFEDDLHRHVHLENNVLFPRALAL